MLAVFVYSSFREEKPCVHTPDSSTINDSFLDTVTRLIGCELLLGSSVFSLSVFHPLDGLAVQVITRSSATGRFPCSTIADGGTRTGGSWFLTSSCFSFFLLLFLLQWRVFTVTVFWLFLGESLPLPALVGHWYAPFLLCRRSDLCFSVKRSRLKSLMAARFIGNQSLCGWSCFSAAVAL